MASLVDLQAMALATTALCVLAVFLVWRKVYSGKRRSYNLPPAVPGLPLIGNLLQLKERKPHQTFAKWAEIHGPIFSIRLGSSNMVVLNSAEVAKEAMVTKFSSISTRKVSNTMRVLTSNKALVAVSDYGEYHKMVKRYILTSMLGANAQKQHRRHRNTMIENITNILHAEIEDNPHSVVILREGFKAELFKLTLKEAIGKEVEPIYVDELGVEVSKEEMFDILVVDPMMGAIEVDWRDFFPYMRWVPNKSTEMKIQRIATRKEAVTKALIMEQKKRIALGEDLKSYLDYLVSVESTLTEEQQIALVWESIIEASDTTLVTTEWAMYELAKHSKFQDRLFWEIQQVCGSEKITEEHLPKMPFLNAVFHETLRRHSPAAQVPPRYVHEDTQIGGYDIPAGTEIVINLYACNMDRKAWEEPEEWNPERFLSDEFEQTDMHKTMAFGAGKRMCAGSLQAMLISCTAIGRFIQEFQWSLGQGEEENVDTVVLTSHKLHPLRAYITPR